MKYQGLDFDIRDNVAWITINRPDRFNAMDLQLMKDLYEVANRCGSDRAVRAAVLTGAGDQAFCAGGDVADFAGNQDKIDLLLKDMTTYFHAAVSRFAAKRRGE